MSDQDEPLPDTLQKYVDHIAQADRPLDFLEVISVTPGVNQFRHLRRRGLIQEVRWPRYILTDAGHKHVSANRGRG